jgi:hypothetical protein
MNVTFVFKGSGSWKVSDADDWDLCSVELTGKEKLLGHRKIDGAIFKILELETGQIIALAK